MEEFVLEIKGLWVAGQGGREDGAQSGGCGHHPKGVERLAGIRKECVAILGTTAKLCMQNLHLNGRLNALPVLRS